MCVALRVHISPDTKVILDQLGGYKLVERGPITMKVRCHVPINHSIIACVIYCKNPGTCM